MQSINSILKFFIFYIGEKKKLFKICYKIFLS